MNPELRPQRRPQAWEETIVGLGADRFGLLCRPRGPARTCCVVLLNAGFMPRSGPFRVHVRLARRLAERGYPVLRFDLPGIGDSVAHADQPTLGILRETLDALAPQAGCSRFVVGGICSAASLGWQIALADPRVVGAILIDAVARRTFSYKLGLLSRAWHKPWSAWWDKLRRLLSGAGRAAGNEDYMTDWPSPGAERSQLLSLVARRVELFFLYTGGTVYFLHRGQFIETFGPGARAPCVQFQHWPRCDHMFYDEADRSELVAAISGWLERRLP